MKILLIILNLTLLTIFSGCTGTALYKPIKIPDLKPIDVTLRTNMSGGLDRKNTMKAFVAITAYRSSVEMYNEFKHAIEKAKE